MANIPREVLSEHFQKLLEGRRVRSAVFVTFRFEPDFFEQEVLPAVLDIPLSHAPTIRLLQLEDTLRSEIDQVAVYYDRDALVAGSQSAKLDVRRIPVSISTGAFHPKNVLLLTESREGDDAGHRERRLILATMSANLTRAGWWENVEVCHVEDIEEGAPCSFRDDLLTLIRRVKAAARVEERHEALDAIHAFARGLDQRRQRTPNGALHPRIYAGGQSVPDFLEEVIGKQIKGLCLEVISPYFDQADAAPLRELQERFTPREIRVFLPRSDEGAALCTDAVYEAIRGLERTRWAQLPADLLRAGKAEQLKRRTVHAKVYRFFDPRRRYEALFVGSVNLTTPAHSRGGNFETGVLIETVPQRIPDWWLEADTKKPSVFEGSAVDDVPVATTALSIRYSWDRHGAHAFWDSGQPPGRLAISAQGAPLFTIDTLPLREWHQLGRSVADVLKQILPSTSFLGVRTDEGLEATILVQEEGMAHKPSLLTSLTAADILRYWALLTPEQRVAFLEERAGTNPESLAAHLVVERTRLAGTDSSMFDTFAGVFHAFGMLERHVLEALEAGRTKAAEYRLLGQKYDSLPHLLERVLADETKEETVTRYVIVLCAKQLVRRVREEHPKFRAAHAGAFQTLERQVRKGERIRDCFTFGTPEERADFLAWFDEWFLKRAEPMEVSA
jgi:hypothetical protein